MDGVDKGLQPLAGKPLIGWVIDRLEANVGEILLSANRSLSAYAAWGYPVIPDATPDFSGPLAGILATAAHTNAPWLLVTPCDTPFLPTDWVARLARAVNAQHPIARACDAAESPQCHYALQLFHRDLLADLADYVASGRRSIQGWHARLPVVDVVVAEPAAFRNLNATAELAAAEAQLANRT